MKYVIMILCVVISNCDAVKETQKNAENIANLPQGTYVVTTINEKQVATEKPLTIIFNTESKSVSGYAGCNQYGCSYQFGDKSVLSFGMIKATEIYCEDTIAIETKMFDALAKVKNYKLQDNVLTLLQGNTILMTAKALQ